VFFTFSTFLQLGYHRQHKTPLCKQSVLRPIQAIRNRPSTTSLLRTFTQCHLQTFSKNLERSRRDAQLRYVVIYGAACSYCLEPNALNDDHLEAIYDVRKNRSTYYSIGHVKNTKVSRERDGACRPKQQPRPVQILNKGSLNVSRFKVKREHDRFAIIRLCRPRTLTT
jgi:hypothetical protein